MAFRKRTESRDRDWRDKIKAGVIMDRLQKHILGEIEMTTTQIKAADILLRKIVPDLARTELTGKDGGDLVFRWDDCPK